MSAFCTVNLRPTVISLQIISKIVIQLVPAGPDHRTWVLHTVSSINLKIVSWRSSFGLHIDPTTGKSQTRASSFIPSYPSRNAKPVDNVSWDSILSETRNPSYMIHGMRGYQYYIV